MQDEGPAHAEPPPKRPASKTTLSLGDAWPGVRVGSGAFAMSNRPGEDEGGEVDLMGELEEAAERGGPGMEGGRPGLDMGDVVEAARQRVQQLLLLPR